MTRCGLFADGAVHEDVMGKTMLHRLFGIGKIRMVLQYKSGPKTELLRFSTLNQQYNKSALNVWRTGTGRGRPAGRIFCVL
jgi:hypothetical protein